MTKEIKIEYHDDGWTGDIHPGIDPGPTTTLLIDWADRAKRRRFPSVLFKIKINGIINLWTLLMNC